MGQILWHVVMDALQWSSDKKHLQCIWLLYNKDFTSHLFTSAVITVDVI